MAISSAKKMIKNQIKSLRRGMKQKILSKKALIKRRSQLKRSDLRTRRQVDVRVHRLTNELNSMRIRIYDMRMKYKRLK